MNCMEAALLLSFAACSLPTSPTDEPITELERQGFQQAKSDIIKVYDINPLLIINQKPENFRWHKETGDSNVWCGDISNTPPVEIRMGDEVFTSVVAGCFISNLKTIVWHEKYPDTLVHECGHAILWAAGHSKWHCYEHGCL